MDEIRFQSVERAVSKHGVQLEEHAMLHREHDRRFTDQGHLIGSHAQQLKAQAELLAALQHNTETQNKMIETGENIIEALSLLGKICKWILAVAGVCTLIVAWIKAYLKLEMGNG